VIRKGEQMMSQPQMRWCWCLTIGLALGCQASVPERGVSARLEEGDILDYASQQGRRLLGFNGADVRRFTFAPPVSNARAKDNGILEANGMSGKDFADAKLTATAGTTTIEMRIAEVLPPETANGKWHYRLEQLDPASNAWLPACAQPAPVFPSPPPAGLAIAMPGWWTDDRVYVDDAQAVTFSCLSGVAAKCDGWGYSPTAQTPPQTESGQPNDNSGPDVTVACVRMASADYCGIGLPTTFDGTPIHIHDVFGGPHHPEQPLPGFYFEAAWRGRAIGKEGRRIPGPALCLSKLRWATLPPGGSCPAQVPDPRISRRGNFCEDYTAAQLEQMGATIYDDSPYLDAGLLTWSDNTPATAYFTSTMLVAERYPLPPTWQITPPPGLVVPKNTFQLEATIFHRTLPQTWAASLAPLYSWSCPGGDLATTTVDLSASCDQIAHEGYVYPPNTPGRPVLRRWLHPTSGHSRTTARSPAAMIADGWHLSEVVGGVPRASFDVTVSWSVLAGYAVSLDLQTNSGEWIAPCISAAQLGSATSVVGAGNCTAAGRVVGNADIAAFRVVYTKPNAPTRTATRPYDGVAPETYVAIAKGKPTAVSISWNDLGSDYTYALDVHTASTKDWTSGCVGEELLANDTGHVFSGRCASSGATIALDSIKEVRVCAARGHDWNNPTCGTATYEGKSTALAITIPK
jgi:hypothetical protein